MAILITQQKNNNCVFPVNIANILGSVNLNIFVKFLGSAEWSEH